MREGRPSRTAEYMALFRAVESCRPAQERLFSDPYAVGFLTPALRALALAARAPALGGLVPRLIDRRNPGPRVSALVRTRLIDDVLLEALAAGASQLVLLGAGYDCRPYRLAEAAGARAFEVDHPDTQAAKRSRLGHMRGSPPENVVWVAVDFLREDFGAALLRAGYDPAERALFIWEGVTNYLDADTVDGTLRWIARNSAGASRLAFTYVDRGLLDGSVPFTGSERWVAAVRRAGEPFTFGLVPAELEAYLAERGLCLLSDVSTAAALARFPQRAAGLPRPPAFYRVAVAEVIV